MVTTIKVGKETKDRLLSLDLAEKGKTFDMIINELVSFYQKSNEEYVKDYKRWKKNIKIHEKELKDYYKKKEMWDNLLKWAKSKGFKG